MEAVKVLTSYVALLRGVNVGGKNKLPMKDLAAMFAAVECEGAKTYIQSGNVVFRADQRTAARVSETISAAIAKQFGFQIAVLTRSAKQMQQVLASNPFLKRGAPADKLYVAFLYTHAQVEALQQIDRAKFLPDEFALVGNEIFLYLPNGAGKSKLALTVDAKLRKACTMRNWRTTEALLKLMQELE